MAISSTTLSSTRSCSSRVSWLSSLPPSASATAEPPARSCRWRITAPPTTTATTPRATRPNSSGSRARARGSGPPSWPSNSTTARATSTLAAMISPATASSSRSTRRPVRRRARSWAVKKSIALPCLSGRSSEAYPGCGLDLGAVLELQQRRILPVAEGGGHHHRRKALLVGVVLHHRIVEGLAGEGDAVLGAGQGLAELAHVLGGLEVGIGLHHHVETPQGRAQGPLGAGKRRHGAWLAGVGRGILQPRQGAVARLGHRLQGLALVAHVGPGGLHQVGNQVVAALELYLDLGEGVLEAVLQRHQAVVDRDRIDHQQADHHQRQDKRK